MVLFMLLNKILLSNIYIFLVTSIKKYVILNFKYLSHKFIINTVIFKHNSSEWL